MHVYRFPRAHRIHLKRPNQNEEGMSGGVTIHEMESVARGLDIGRGITEIGSDGLGFEMLANTGGRAGSGGNSTTRQISFDLGGTVPDSSRAPSAQPEIEISPMEPISINLGGSMNGGANAPIEIDFAKSTDMFPKSTSASETASGGLFANLQTASGPFTTLSPAESRLSPEEERKEKIDLLNKLQRMEQKGLTPSRRFTMDNTLEEIKTEFSRLADARNLESSIRFQRQAMMSVVTGLQWMNDKFDPFDLKLDGWSESVHENLEDFDEIFEELYDKYKERGKMPPEARLVMALAGSGFMCHVSNTFLRARMPSMDDILRQNPEMARQFATAAAKQAGPGFGNFMSMAMGPGASAGGAGGAPIPPTGSFFGASNAPPMAQVPQSVAAMEPRQVARREMKGPSGVDDILKTFEEVRRNDAMEGITVQPVRSEMQPAVSAAVEVQSISGSDDLGSMVGSVSGRRRGRRAAPPSGNTIALDV